MSADFSRPSIDTSGDTGAGLLPAMRSSSAASSAP
jgi:hypothetical protein